MKTEETKMLSSSTLLTGYGLTLLSAAVFVMPEIFHLEKTEDTLFGIFIMNFFITIFFGVLVYIREVPRFTGGSFQRKAEWGFVHLVLCLISAFSLNRVIPVFQDSAVWLQVVLIIQALLLLSAFFRERLPVWLQGIFWILMGVTFTLFLYFSITLIPVYLVGVVASPIFLISLHAFVPLAIVTAIILFLLREDNRIKRNIIYFLSGIILSVIIVSVWTFQWSKADRIISRATDKTLMNEWNDLPEWAAIAQELPDNSVTEKILKTGLVYSVPSSFGDWGLFNLPPGGFDEVKRHDPLVMIATFILGKPDLSSDQKVKILESMYDSRHKAQERLWSGEDLCTNHILTNVRLYPSLHIAYTEKIISIRNTSSKRGRRNQDEAIYTFHLPEGAIVTSLSLWINGREENAVLTSKGKADTAYRKIVGIEMRDPSLVRWQEGNTVSVRVFPCTPEEDRRFRIGFTTPLTTLNGKMRYSNIWFDGPDTRKAFESIKIQSMDHPETLISNIDLNEQGPDTWMAEAKYNPEWHLEIPETKCSEMRFSFDGKTYSINDYKRVYTGFMPRDVYIDLNNSWSKDEWDKVLESAGEMNVFVFHDRMIRVTSENRNKIFEQLSRLNFSLFPFYEISDPALSMVISKGGDASPNLSDIKGSSFAGKLKSYLSENHPVRLFAIDGQISPYLRTLREFRSFEYDSGTIEYLGELLQSKKYPEDQESCDTVVITSAGIMITEADGTTISDAPDHLMRLFAYNSIMQVAGAEYFSEQNYRQELVDKAHKAYVVTPFTSLIVLETQEDYKASGIKDEGTSLKNASMKSSGAVPEPHEWMLIMILAGTVLFIIIRGKGFLTS